jgi:Tfp pilus assembly protein PilF
MIADYNCRLRACKDTVAKAKHFAKLALNVDPASAEAHTANAVQLVLFSYNESAAEKEYQTAIALDPSYALAHQWYGTALLMQGHMPEARHELEAAVALQPVATATNVELGMQAYFDHRYAQAVAYNRRALDLNPNRMDSWLILGLSQEQLGAGGDALASFGRFGELCKCKAESQLLQAGMYARMGRHEEALAAIKAAFNGSSMLPPDEVAIAFIQIGDRERALSYMRRVKFKNISERLFLALDPRMDPVRGDSRFRRWTSAV